MKKLFDISVGGLGETVFARDGEEVDLHLPENLVGILKRECSPHVTGSDGAVVYMTTAEYSRYLELSREDRK